ncbi:portal protein, partial [Herbiconiux daphne]
MSFDVVTGNVVLDDEKLVDLQRQIGIYHNHAIGYHEGELGVRVRMGWDYYYGRLPAPITPGSSKQIMPVVWNSVNGVLGELQSAFTAGDEVVRFTPLGPEDGIAANLATKMVNKILLHDNDGFNAMSDAFKECLIARNGFVKRYWGKSKKTLIEEFEDLTKDELDIFLANIDGDIVELYTEETKSVEIDEKGKEKEVSKLKNEKPTPKGEEKFKGRVIYEKVTEGVKVEYVPFEEVIIEPT